ncbi:hypothetical protein PR048_011696 [Dryococelus australis]|uniref:Uncharacterized protein n=1 Tax=Dryococelus australis TaxID=614101 RepID=A0ABQ9HMC5_9NEOP|nr:hypothetical protein PR048_011696 [Dryococelus australis]
MYTRVQGWEHACARITRKKEQGKREIPKKTHSIAASFCTIPTCENLGTTPLGIKPGSPSWEASILTTTPPLCNVQGHQNGDVKDLAFLGQCSLSGEKLSADTEAAKKFVVTFTQLVSDEKLSPEQVYNADETALYWRCMPRSILFTPDDAHTGMKESKG